MSRKSDTGLPHTKTVRRNGVAYVYFNTGEKVERRPVYAPLGRKDAVEFGAKYSAALAGRTRRKGLPGSLTVPQLVIQYERCPDFAKKKSVGTQKTYSVYLRRLAKEFNTAPAAALETSDILQLMDRMADRPAAVDMLIITGKQMFAWARKRKMVPHNPFEAIDREEWEAEQYEPWPEDVLDAALADEKIRLPVAVLYYTAQRIGDVCRMRWDDIGLDPHTGRERIFVTQQKTGKELYVPLHEKLLAALATAPHRGETILADEKGRKAKDQTIRMWLKKFGRKFGLDLVPHGLRKNAVNALLEAGCSTGETSSISGQSLRIVEHYARRRNSTRMSRGAMAKWEQATNRETPRKTPQET